MGRDLLTSRIHPRTNHLANVKHDDGQRADGVSQRGVDFYRRTRGFLVGGRGVVATFFDSVLETAVADGAAIVVEGPIGAIGRVVVGKMMVALSVSKWSSPVEGHCEPEKCVRKL